MSRRPTRSSVEPETRRAAIYTRKSTTMGLEQEFNSLDSQRESCLAYIQRQPGWKLVDERYDDGGFTGANIDRPAFTRLMADVEAGKVDVIVVYKVDRLSRSLIISRSNSAKDINMFIVSRPIASAVEKFCVMETKDAPAVLRRSITFTKSRSERERRSTL